MSDILSGLGDLGLGKLEGMSVLGDAKGSGREAPAQIAENAAEDMRAKEAACLFDKEYTCPVCDIKFKSKTVRTGKVRKIGADEDLRPLFTPIDATKYEPVVCPRCGYAAFPKTFAYVTDFQRGEIEKNISANYKPIKENGDVYDYETALKRFQMALANAIVMQKKTSDRAYICLKMAWIVRGYREELEKQTGDAAKARLDELVKSGSEKEYLQTAYDGFVKARESEHFPICDMDESAFDYLLAALSMELGYLDVAAKMIAGLLVSRSANSRIKDKARDMKERLLA